MRGPSNLTKTQREMIAVVVSAEAVLNDGPRGRVAATNAHDPTLVDRLLANHRQAELGEHDRAILDLAVKLTQTPEDCQQSDVDRLRQAGYSNADILHIAELTAIFNYDGRLANGLGLVANQEYHGLGRATRASD